MAQFIYFIPGVTGSASREQIEAAGLAYAFPPGTSLHQVSDSQTPHGIGSLLSSEPRFPLKDLAWIRLGAAFLGVHKNKAERPRPKDLRRADGFVDGHPVMLGDGQHWVVPVVRFADGNTSLPCVLHRKENGEYGYQVREEYRGIVGICDLILHKAIEGGGHRLSPETTMAFAQGILSINYRVSEAEISALELIDSLNVRELARAAMDVPSMVLMLEQIKKKLTDAQSESGLDCATGTPA